MEQVERLLPLQVAEEHGDLKVLRHGGLVVERVVVELQRRAECRREYVKLKMSPHPSKGHLYRPSGHCMAPVEASARAAAAARRLAANPSAECLLRHSN